MDFRPIIPLALLALTLASAVAADPTPTPTPEATPVPNTTDLRGFVDQYKVGRSEVTVTSSQTSTYRGRARFSITAPSETSLKVLIQANVKTPKGLAAIDNRFLFLSTGVVKGKELAPGIARQAPFAGLYTARNKRLTFQGNFVFGDSSGTVTGEIRLNLKGKLSLIYSIFVTGQTEPVHTYAYDAIRRKKKPSPARR